MLESLKRALLLIRWAQVSLANDWNTWTIARAQRDLEAGLVVEKGIMIRLSIEDRMTVPEYPKAEKVRRVK
jgi:hypothetical protein